MKMKMENVKNDDLYNVEVEERVFKTESLEDKASTAIVAQAMVAPDFKNRDVIGKSFWTRSILLSVPMSLDGS